jgi:cellulose biosynthesis protein BcsQ
LSECIVRAISNQKGGVGKTTVCLNLGAGLARQGQKVLLIDFDVQANLTQSMGCQMPDELPFTIADIMKQIIEDEPIDLSRGIIHHREGIDLLPASIELSGIENSLVHVMNRERILKSYVNQLRSRYDSIIIDCMPSLGMLTINALTAADRVIVPVQAHFLSVKGLELLLRTVSKVKKQLNPDLNVEGILLNMNNVLVKSFTIDEQNRFFEAARDSRLYNAFLISVDTGLRTGELLALEWGDIDFAQKYISVTKGLAVVNDRSPDRKTKTITIVQDSPKTETSVRLVPLTNRSYKLLLDMYKNRTSNIVFPSENNTHIGPRNYIRTFHKILAKAGLPKCGPHVLRHTFVTRCFENDVSSKVISELVGHAKLSHTMDIYTHVAFRIKRDAVEALNNLYDYQMRMEKRGDQLG